VTVTIQKVQLDNSLVATTDVKQSDVRTTAGNGAIVLVTGGDLTLNDGTAATDMTALSAHGTGNVLLTTTGSTTINAAVLSGTGHITVLATATLAQNANLTTGTTGTVDLEANLISASLTSNVTTGSGDIRFLSATNIILGGVITTTGNVSLTATAGSISDLDANAAVDIVATGLRLVAGLGLGTTTNHLETTITTLTARATSGGIYLDETNALIVDDVTVTIQKVGVDAGVTATTDVTQSDVRTTAGNGSIVLVTGGDLTLNDGTAATDTTSLSAHGTGNVLLTTTGATTINAAVLSGTGHITVLATATLAQNANLTTASTGTVDLEANLISASLTSNVTSGSGDIRFLSATDIILGGVITTTGNVSLTATAGSISDLDANAAVDIVATGLRLVAGLGLGTTTNHLETTITTLTARATSGGIYLDETNALIVDDVTVTIQKVQLDNSLVATTDVKQSDVRTTAGNGAIVLVTGGDLTLNDGTAATDMTALSAHGTGNVLLSTTGATTVNADLLSGSGHLTVLATATLAQNANLTTGTTGTVDLEANLISASLTSNVTTGTGAIRFLSATNIILGGVITTTGHVSLTAMAGSISDLDANAAVDIVATGLRLVAGLGLGTTTNHLETTVTTLTARATSGGIYLDETNALIVDDVDGDDPEGAARQHPRGHDRRDPVRCAHNLRQRLDRAGHGRRSDA
jgi:hypothetical protein